MTQIRSRLRLTPAQRLDASVAAINNVRSLLRDRRPTETPDVD